MVNILEPSQGELLKLDLDLIKGHEQSGYRPVLVVSATNFNRYSGVCWVVPITSRRVRVPTEMRLPDGLGATGTLLLAHLRSVNWRARRFNRVGSVPADFLKDVNGAVASVHFLKDVNGAVASVLGVKD
jgi:mRNA interferase MazF